MLTSKSSAALLILALAVPLATPLTAMAQDNAAPATTEAAAQEPSGMHRAIRWAQTELQEMDAAITVLEENTAKLSGDARTKAEAELEKLRAVRQEYERSLEEAAATTDAKAREEAQRLGTALATQWDEFEANLAAYYDVAKADYELRRAVFLARAHAQQAAFQQDIDALNQSTAAAAEGVKARLDEHKSALQARLREDQDKLDRLGAATNASWEQFVDGLRNARAAFKEELAKGSTPN